MANSLFQTLGGNQAQQGAARNFAPALLQHIQGFQGDPIPMVQGKLRSGEWTQEQYNEVRKASEQVARRMMGVLRR